MKNQARSLSYNLPSQEDCSVCIIGLGYVGLPLAVQIGNTRKSFKNKLNLNREVIGFDINSERIKELKKGIDSTLEIEQKELTRVLEKKFLKLTNVVEDIFESEVFIITVPTPIDKDNKPDLSLIIKASKMIGKCLKEKHIVDTIPIIIFESTVYPGATEEICIPIIEKNSGFKLNNIDKQKCFYCGYSPERINPGDKKHTISDIKKVTSGSNKISSEWINNFYQSFIRAGTHLAPSIKVAEAAKIIENTQRDLNIALVNELSIIFEKMNIDTLDTIEAASTKWNFIKYTPGLVGGHCIGVDPYYLTYKSKELGYEPNIVLAGRTLNDGMSKFIVNKLLFELKKKNIKIDKCNILILGITFKENCPDLRNSKVIEIIDFLKKYQSNIQVVDPLVNTDTKLTSQVKISNFLDDSRKYDVILSTVKHNYFLTKDITFWKKILNKNHIIFDIKGFMPRELNTIRL